jgi:hypothetical protein
MRCLLLTVLIALPTSAEDNSCVLKVPLPVVMSSGGGEVEATLPPGTEVSITGTGDWVRARTGASVVSTVRADWLAACDGTLHICATKGLTSLFSEARSDAAAQSLPAQTELHIRRTGKVWAEVGALRDSGYVLVSKLGGTCVGSRSRATVTDDSAVVKFTPSGGPFGEVVERGEGPGVWVTPFESDGVVPEGIVDGHSSRLWEVWARSRPDAAVAEREPVQAGEQLASQLAHARRLGMAYIISGRVFAAGGGDVVTVEVSVYDSATNKQLKGLRVRPGERAEWAVDVVRTFWPQLRQAPGQQQPERGADQMKGLEIATIPR